MDWVKIGRTVTETATTITYKAVGTGYTIESRKRQIPHSNRSGTWAYTSYFVLKDGKELCEKHRLLDAARFCEEAIQNEP